MLLYAYSRLTFQDRESYQLEYCKDITFINHTVISHQNCHIELFSNILIPMISINIRYFRIHMCSNGSSLSYNYL